MTNTTKHKVGDTVHIPLNEWDKGGTFTVKKVNPTTYALDRPEGGRGVKAPHDMVYAGPHPGETKGPGGAVVTEFASPVIFNPGTVVRHKRYPEKLLVVTGITGDKHRLFPLGGSDRYYRGVPGAVLTEVTEITDWKKV